MRKGTKLIRFVSVLLCILLLPVGALVVGASLPEVYSESYYAQLAPMVRRLKEAEGKKLVLIGGSNIAFGIDVAQLEEEFPGYTVCPMGLYAAVGTSAMLQLSEPYLSEGDIVVLAIEPSDETFSTYFGANAFLKCAEGDSSLLLAADADQSAALVGSYVGYLQERFEIVRTGNLPRVEGVYARSSFDDNCNMTYPREGNTMSVGFDTTAMVDFGSITIEEAFMEQVNAYIATARKQGAEVYLSFSPVNQSALSDNWQEGLEQFYTLCGESFDCAVISNPERYVLESGWFYDNNFHLNTAGSQVRTHYLACDLLAQLGIYAEPAFEMPQMPEPVRSEEGRGEEEAGAEEFVLEDYAGGWQIVGLSEEGRSKTALTVPAYVEDKPVIAFTAEAFAGADRLEELTLPETVEAIPDGAFENTPNLKRLVLLHTSTVCALGEEPFRGADSLKVYVPKAAYGLYRDGAGCEENQWQPYLKRIESY